jgi:lipoprotein signal peptidase
MADRSYRGLLAALALAGILLDQGTKYGVFRWLYPTAAGRARAGDAPYDRYPIVPGALEFLVQFRPEPVAADDPLRYLRAWSGAHLPHVNEGALFGLGQQYAHLANRVFAGVSVLAAVAIGCWSVRRGTARDGPLCAALGLILAGTLGNLYDRVVFGGVRDFLHFYWFEFPVFNVADCCLVCGAALLLLQAFRKQPAAAKEPAPAEPRPHQAVA